MGCEIRNLMNEKKKDIYTFLAENKVVKNMSMSKKDLENFIENIWVNYT